jgi:Fic family protein
VPPPPDLLPDVLGDLERFLHQASPMPLLIKIGLAHAQFETIHPFLDGNGRVGRLLITFLLCENHVLLKPVLYLSHYFKRHRQRYYDLLQVTRDRGDYEKWLEFFLTGVAEVSAEATDTARRILALRESHRALITDELGRGAGNGHRVLEYLFEHPIVSVNELCELTGTTYPATNQMVDRLVHIGILLEITGRARHRRFRYEPYVDLFADAPENGTETAAELGETAT